MHSHLLQKLSVVGPAPDDIMHFHKTRERTFQHIGSLFYVYAGYCNILNSKNHSAMHSLAITQKSLAKFILLKGYFSQEIRFPHVLLALKAS